MRPVGRIAIVPGLALAALACGAGCRGSQEAVPGPPAAIHGAVVIEPGELRVGELVAVEVSVVTPPDHRVRPLELAESIPPLWLLDAERLPPRREGERWVHTTRVRARVREVPGEYAWPAQPVEVEDASGEVTSLELEPRPFRVVSLAESLPDRLEPFGLRAPEAPSRTGGSLGAALLGSAATLLALAGVSWLRRRRRRRTEAAGDGAEEAAPWVRADRELRAALERSESDPRAAADEAALALRRYVHGRARRPVESATTEEIAAQRPPGRMRSRWPELVALLRRLDAVRFPGDLDREEGRVALRRTLEEARSFVADSTPPRELR